MQQKLNKTIVGVDEVGRGVFAGPLVMGAVILGEKPVEGLRDSKKLSRARREELDELIRSSGTHIGLGWVSPAEIDSIGLAAALRKAAYEAVLKCLSTWVDPGFGKKVQSDVSEGGSPREKRDRPVATGAGDAVRGWTGLPKPDYEIFLDGTVNLLAGTEFENHTTTLAKADDLIPAVSAASIVAKVARDNYMTKLSDKYPEYGFADHVGYGTATHRAAIEKHGIIPGIHRLSIGPLRKYACEIGFSKLVQPRTASPAPVATGRSRFSLGLPPSETSLWTNSKKPNRRNTTQIGNQAETKACEYLQNHGHRVLARNWKNKFCEIDIISKKDNIIYFVEVKYRSNKDHGDGLAAITPAKVKQMKFAVELFTAQNINSFVEHGMPLSECDLRIAAISLSGANYDIDDFLICD